MRLVGFNTGTIRPQIIDGEKVLTACVKTPVAEPWVITPTGAAGDEVAVHTDHLYVFDRASYNYWAAELGVPRDDWDDGMFSENLTVDELDQSSLRVGDRFLVGTAMIVVTGPRVPCWKLTWRLDRPKPFMRRFRLSGRSGAYFGVVSPGVVGPGDELVLLDRDPDAPTVAELSRLCDSGTTITPAERTVIDRALAHEHLSETVRGTLTLKMANLARDAASADGWRGWRRFTTDEIVWETSETASFVLRPADRGVLPAFRAGQHVVVRLSFPGETPVVRTWSLSDYDAEPEHYRITVRIRDDGRGSTALLQGATVDLRTPAGRFHLDRGTFRPVVLVAAGIGITPMIAMIRAHLDRAGFVPPLWLIYGTPTAERTAFRGYLDELFAAHDDLWLHYVHSRTHGRITAERVVDVMRGNYLRTDDGPASIPWFESDIYLCGSPDFTAALRDGLVDAGANPDLVFAEDFAAAAVAPDEPHRREDATVGFGARGPTVTWSSDEQLTLLELAEANGLTLPYDCRAGTCRTCEVSVVRGEVEGPVSGGRALLCTSYPLSDAVVVEL